MMHFMSTSDEHKETLLQNESLKLQIELEQLHSEYRNGQEGKQLLNNDINHNDTSIKLPDAYTFQPHLLNSAKSLHPAFIHSKGRSGVSIVLGIPTIKRESQSYLLQTLNSLLEQMNSTEAADTLIVVLIAEVKRIVVNSDKLEQIDEH